uniref:HAT C-terminal dimerisation domain-containing protein n=1 Tax=Amphimedon queenslandica TaxID=400682 RepID=A0A1X7UFJ8_AMPQE
MTVAVSTAQCERSFSTLKLIKNHLRSTMGDERLANMAVLSIERELSGGIYGPYPYRVRIRPSLSGPCASVRPSAFETLPPTLPSYHLHFFSLDTPLGVMFCFDVI